MLTWLVLSLLLSVYFKIILNLLYLNKETKNSETIFVINCLGDVSIFGVVAHQVQLLT